MKKKNTTFIFQKRFFSIISESHCFSGEKNADLNNPGYYLSDDTKSKNSPLHHHNNGFSQNSVHWWRSNKAVFFLIRFPGVLSEP